MIELSKLKYDYQIEVTSIRDCKECGHLIKKHFPSAKISEYNGAFHFVMKHFRWDFSCKHFNNMSKSEFTKNTITVDQFKELVK